MNTNKLVRFYDGVDGLKTGYTKEAGYCLTATAKKDNMRLIAVAMGEPDSKTRNGEITSLLNYGFSQYKLIDLLKDKTLGNYKIDKAKNTNVEIIPKDPVTVLTKKTAKDKYTYEIEMSKVKLPINKGDVVGKLAIKNKNKTVRNVDLTVPEKIKKANFINLYLRYLKDIMIGNIIYK